MEYAEISIDHSIDQMFYQDECHGANLKFGRVKYKGDGFFTNIIKRSQSNIALTHAEKEEVRLMLDNHLIL